MKKFLLAVISLIAFIGCSDYKDFYYRGDGYYNELGVALECYFIPNSDNKQHGLIYFRQLDENNKQIDRTGGDGLFVSKGRDVKLEDDITVYYINKEEEWDTFYVNEVVVDGKSLRVRGRKNANSQDYKDILLWKLERCEKTIWYEIMSK